MSHDPSRPPAVAPPAGEEFHDDIIYPNSVPFTLAHLACFGAIFTGVSAPALWLAFGLYVARMFGITAGYHRYFSHRTFKTSRAFQFVLALLAQSSAQRGVLWWAGVHRHHHRHSDTPEDVHSPRHRGFWYSHWGWVFNPKHGDTDLEAVPDLAKYPELRWLDRNEYVPAAVLATICFATMGWQGLIVGFFWSTAATYHGTFFINSLAHVHGRQRYVTGDDSRNNWWLAIITLGEGWHNNHHAYQRSTRQGFRWYEYDPTFYVLKALSWARVVWDLGEPPADVVANERPLGRAVVEKVARQLAESFAPAHIAQQVRDQVAHLVDEAVTARDGAMAAARDARDEAVAAARGARDDAAAALAARLAELQLPHLPTLADVRARAQQLGANSPSMDEVVRRARERLLHAVALELSGARTA